MAEIINLNKFRKQKARRQKSATAAENRTAHGQSKAAKKTLMLENKRAKKALEDKRLQESEDPEKQS